MATQILELSDKKRKLKSASASIVQFSYPFGNNLLTGNRNCRKGEKALHSALVSTFKTILLQ